VPISDGGRPFGSKTVDDQSKPTLKDPRNFVVHVFERMPEPLNTLASHQ
jgi:hypothetical protein